MWCISVSAPRSGSADDLFLLSANAKRLGELLVQVGDFARKWRLEFVHPDLEKTKSHCVIFGGDVLAETPSWVLSGQPLMLRAQSEHLGVVLDSHLSATSHVDRRVNRARAAFYGLAPAGVLTKGLCPADKAYLWQTVVLPVLIFGCATTPLRAADVEQLEKMQSNCVKAAFGLPRSAHHSALLAASGIPTVQEELRGTILRVFRSAMCSHHRLQQALITSLAKLALNPIELEGSFLLQVYKMYNNDYREVMELAAGGPVDRNRVRTPRMPDGLADSLKFVLGGSCEASRRLLRLLTCN